jgi:putative hydrolase of the HAD superfamily|tara:strand:+ start:757 stop:1458 length:702 start_codon:yes stop_codon:yes gene_type:complete
MKTIRVITLDLDDTLWDIAPVIELAEKRLWAWFEENYSLIPKFYSPDKIFTLRSKVVKEFPDKSHDFRFIRKVVLSRIAAKLNYDADFIEKAFSVFDQARNEVNLYPDVLPALQKLCKHFTIIAVTNGNANLDDIGIKHFFKCVVTAADVGVPKPERPIFEEAIKMSGVKTHEIIHVGDNPEIDIIGAYNLGLRTAWVNRNNSKWPSIHPEPDVTIKNLGDLYKVLLPSIVRD